MLMNDFLPRGDEALRLLSARLDDLSARAERGEPALSVFLTPREARYAATHLTARRGAGTAVLWGGYPDSERVRALLLPDYTEGMVDPATLATDPVTALQRVGLDELSDFAAEAVVPLAIRGSGYRPLSHRDYLGSALGLGLTRDALGDILVTSEHEACLFTGARMAAFLVGNLQKVATDTVTVERLSADTALHFERRMDPIRDTVASARLDCVVAALCNLSRDQAQTVIRRGSVEMDYETATDCDRPVDPPAVISVRGVGKFSVTAFDGENRRGRIRLVAGKYI